MMQIELLISQLIEVSQLNGSLKSNISSLDNRSAFTNCSARDSIIVSRDRNSIGDKQDYNSDRDKISIGLIAALPKEYAAIKALLENTKPYRVPGIGAGRSYLLGDLPAVDGGKHYLVLALMADTGNNAASARATLLFEHFPNIESIIMVGIAGGVPNHTKSEDHVRLGDLVISNKEGVVQYDLVKEEKTEITHRPPPRPPSPELLEAVRLLEAEDIFGNSPWIKYIEMAMEKLHILRPPEETDILSDSLDTNRIIPHPNDPLRTKNLPRIFLGKIAASNTLLKNPLKRDELRNKFGVKAIEMEGSGIADAAWNHGNGYLVIRGICDYCDDHKNDIWQKYAAVVAAAYTRSLIESIPT